MRRTITTSTTRFPSHVGILAGDSGGDGWQGAAYSIYSSTSATRELEGDVLVTGTLVDGAEGSEWLCLTDGCYELYISGGTANTEISFSFVDEVRVACARVHVHVLVRV